MAAQIVHTVADDAWRLFVEVHPQGNVFHSPEMFQVFSEAKGHQPFLWAAVDEHRHLQALLLPVQITLISGFLRWFTARSVVYGGVLCTPLHEGREALAELLHAHKRQAQGKLLFTELRNISDSSALQPVLEDCGYTYQEHLNYLIDLDRPPEAVLQGMGRRTRKQIRRALRQGNVSVEEVQCREQLAPWYELLQKTYSLAQVPLPDRSLFEAAFEILYPRGAVKFLLARTDGACAACSAELLYKDRIYGWYSGMDRAYASYVPNELLMWHILQWGAENGYRVYDFGGAGRPDEDYGVRDFKAKFGGDLVGYGRNTLVHAPVKLKASKIGYHVYRYGARLRTWGRDML